jgi:hypothetical protein
MKRQLLHWIQSGLTSAILLSAMALASNAQEPLPQLPEAAPEMKILRHDAGTWNADIAFFTPDGELKSSGMEVNRMIGDYWLVGDFEMELMGVTFRGHGTMGFDAKTKQFTGSWIDSMNPHAAHVTGTWDEASRTITYSSEGLDMMGNPEKSKMTTTYSPDWQTRTFIRYVQLPGSEEWEKVMRVVYKKAPEKESAPAAPQKQ